MLRNRFVLILAVALMASPTFAAQLTYHPTNPTFGGNPLNGNYLLSTAQTQGQGVKSGQQQTPDLSGLDSALSNLGGSTGSSTPVIVIGGSSMP